MHLTERHTAHAIKRLALCVLGALLTACTATVRAPVGDEIFNDHLFAASAEAATAADVFTLNEEMRRYASERLQFGPDRRDPRRALIELLYTQSELGLRYDASVTRNAAQAFSERAGNCLSLVVMTAAFAKHLGLPVSYRSVQADTFYTRQGDLTMASGHVNLVLDQLSPLPQAPSRIQHAPAAHEALVVDFLPPQDLRGTKSEALSERTIMAMYLNNRAAEALNEERLDDSYAWASAAVRQDPGFDAALNTLGVVYLRAGHPVEAETVFRAVLAGQPDHVAALTNLVRLLQQARRPADAAALSERLARLQPFAPFHFFDMGRAALAEGDAEAALRLFERELKRQPLQPEVHYWAARAALRLGKAGAATDHLRQAMDNSLDRHSQGVYAAKLEHLRALPLQ